MCRIPPTVSGGAPANIDEVVRIVKGLQLFDATQLTAPANWPHNEIIGDKVLVPPSTKLTETELAEQHVTQLSDWFRYRELSRVSVLDQ